MPERDPPQRQPKEQPNIPATPIPAAPAPGGGDAGLSDDQWYQQYIAAHPDQYDTNISKGQWIAWRGLWDPATHSFFTENVDAAGQPIKGSGFGKPVDCPVGTTKFNINQCLPMSDWRVGGGQQAAAPGAAPAAGAAAAPTTAAPAPDLPVGPDWQGTLYNMFLGRQHAFGDVGEENGDPLNIPGFPNQNPDVMQLNSGGLAYGYLDPSWGLGSSPAALPGSPAPLLETATNIARSRQPATTADVSTQPVAKPIPVNLPLTTPPIPPPIPTAPTPTSGGVHSLSSGRTVSPLVTDPLNVTDLSTSPLFKTWKNRIGLPDSGAGWY